MIRYRRFKVVYVPGTWDLFHIGHLRLLKRASKISEWVIAGVDTDESIARDKGRSPVIGYKERAEIVASCRYVDEVVKNKHSVPSMQRLKSLEVEAVVLGSDWKGTDLSGLRVAEECLKVVFFSYTKGISSTQIKRRIANE